MREGIKVTVECSPDTMLLKDVPNGAIFAGTINGYVSAGPFVKIGSLSANLWIVAKLEALESVVFTSTRDDVRDYRRLDVREIVLKSAPAPEEK